MPLSLCIGMTCAVVANDALAAEPSRVVLLTGTDPIQPAALVQLRRVREMLETSAPHGAEVFLDAIDGFRFGTDNLTPEFLALMTKKYAKQRIDLVIGIGNHAADFALKYHETLWPHTPVLLSSVPEEWFGGRALPANFAYVPFRINVSKTLAVADRLQPEARHLVIVGGVSDVDLGMVDRVVQAAALQRSRWPSVETWIGLPLHELERRLAALDKRTAVIYTTVYRDRDGHRYFPVQLVAPMVAASHAPIYGWYSTYVSAGMTAGAIYDLEENGRLTGEAALSILRRHGVQGLSLTALPAQCVADVTQLERFGLAASALPEGCRLVNYPRSMYRDYRAAVLAILGVLIAQSITIVALLTQRRSRRRAEADAMARRNELARAARFATVGELSASIAHEVGQPLGAILSNADAAELLVKAARVDVDELQEILSDMKRDALRANDVVVRLRALLQKQAIAFRAQCADDILRNVLPLIDPEARRRNIRIESALEAAGAPVMADHVQLQQVVLNLAINAMDAMHDVPLADRVLTLATRQVSGGVELSVADRGRGLDATSAQRLFEAFYTTKPHGMGLGLSIVRSIVDAHHGRVSAALREGGGTCFSVWLPRAPGGTATGSSGPPQSA